MENKNYHDKEKICNCKIRDSVSQTLAELDFERGLWYAAQTNDLSRVKMLLNKGILPDVQDSSGYTALHYAARNGHLEICKELLNRGSHVDAVTRSGKTTALHRAVSQGHITVVELLLNANADVNIQDSDGFTALHRAIMSENDSICKILIPKSDLTLIDKNNCTSKQLADKKCKNYLFKHIH